MQGDKDCHPPRLPSTPEVLGRNQKQSLTPISPVFLREDVLLSDEAIVAVLEHEMYELNALRPLFESSNGRMTAERLGGLINKNIPGNLHDHAWDAADAAVSRMRDTQK